MAKNVFTQVPKRGDIVVKDIETKTPHYIVQDSFVLEDLDTNVYETVGVVFWVGRNKVAVVYKENSDQPFCNRAWWYLSGYVLDGAEHTGIISARFSSNSWASNIDKTITYSATDMEGLVAALNAAFLADDDFVSQDWYADVWDGKVRIHCDNIIWNQCQYNTAKSGFNLSRALHEITYNVNIRRKHGGKGGDGVISSWYRAMSYYRNDNGKEIYMGGRTSEQTSVKQDYPINLPTWLGTSINNPGDFCAPLRAIYGEGEEGWLRFMKSCTPVIPSDSGNMGMRYGKKYSALLASFMFTSHKVKEPTPMCKAANYCVHKSSQTVEDGEFWLPTAEDIARMFGDITYGTSSSRSSDAVNKGLLLINGSGISNGRGWWTCLRYNSRNAWVANGNNGVFSNNGMYNRLGCAPVSLYPLRSKA